MRNRVGTKNDKEDAFINGGTAVVSQTKPEPRTIGDQPKKMKARPVSISFTDDNLNTIDALITNEVLGGNTRVNRSDIVRAAIIALEQLSSEEVSKLIANAKLQ